MTLPLEQSMEWEMTELTLTIDPNGLWRKQRFEFCNALEDACGGDAKAWDVLAEMGVTSFPPTEQNDVTGRSSQSPNGEARSSVGKG